VFNNANILQPGNIDNAALPYNDNNRFADYTTPRAFFSNGKPTGLTLSFIERATDNSGNISFYFYSSPDLWFNAQTPYVFQDAIDWVRDGGRILFNPRSGQSNPHVYTITHPINLMGKSITIEGSSNNPQINLLLYYPVNISDVYGSLTLKNIDMRFGEPLAINRSNLNLQNGNISLFYHHVSNFTGNITPRNTINFCIDS